MNNNDGQLSSLPEAWGGPFFWFRNDSGNLELIRLADVAESVRAASRAVREYIAAVSA